MKKNSVIKLIFASLFLVVGCLFLFRYDLLQLPAKLIVKRDTLKEKGQVGILLMGSSYKRSTYMVKLYKKGWVKKIIYAEAEFGESEVPGIELPEGLKVDRILHFLGVPKRDRIFLSETRNTSTFEEANVLLTAVKQRFPDTKEIILVTSWYHSSRAKWIFEKVNHFGFEIKSMPNDRPKKWWKHEASFLHVFNEYLKWAYYLLNY